MITIEGKNQNMSLNEEKKIPTHPELTGISKDIKSVTIILLQVFKILVGKWNTKHPNQTSRVKPTLFLAGLTAD